MKKYLIILFLFIFNIAYALEADYETFGGRTISSGSTLGDYIAYYFNLGLAVAAGAAVLIITFAGINYLISGDNFSKRLIAKKMIFNSLFGLFLALGAIAILNTFNPDMDTVIPVINSQDYVDGINLVGPSGKTWTNDNLIKTSDNYTGIEWLSPVEDLYSVYVFEKPEFSGDSIEVPNGSSVPVPIDHSVWFLWNKPGSYILYNGINFTKGTDKQLPFSSVKDNKALSTDIFDNATKSIKINQPKPEDDPETEYGAILFTEDRFQGNCAWTFHDIADLSADPGDSPENNLPIGLDQLSSIKRIVGLKAGDAVVTIYNRANCQWFNEDKSSKKCTIPTASSKQNLDIVSFCEAQNPGVDFTNEEILSIEFNAGNPGVLLKEGKNNTCQYFEKNSPNTCISLIKYGNIYNPEEGILPAQITLFSLKK